MAAPYDRLLDVFVLEDDTSYDFPRSVAQTAYYQMVRNSALGRRMMPFLRCSSSGSNHMRRYAGRVALPDDDGSRSVSVPSSIAGAVSSRAAQLPATGYVSVGVTRSELTSAPWFSIFVKWVSNSGHLGKVRFFAHGSPGGMMRNIDAAALATLLIDCGLRREGNHGTPRDHGLVTLSLVLCYASLGLERPGGSVQPSGVEKVADRLHGRGRCGIEVTGIAAKVVTLSTATLQWPVQQLGQLIEITAEDLSRARVAGALSPGGRPVFIGQTAVALEDDEFEPTSHSGWKDRMLS